MHTTTMCSMPEFCGLGKVFTRRAALARESPSAIAPVVSAVLFKNCRRVDKRNASNSRCVIELLLLFPASPFPLGLRNRTSRCNTSQTTEGFFLVQQQVVTQLRR